MDGLNEVMDVVLRVVVAEGRREGSTDIVHYGEYVSCGHVYVGGVGSFEGYKVDLVNLVDDGLLEVGKNLTDELGHK